VVKCSAGPLASLTTVEQLSLLVGPGAFYYFTDATSGAGASVDSPSKREKLEARKMPKNVPRTHRQLQALLARFYHG